jgi:predicted regulator of Ras-like GTPase activity (Roadblock/LC7/MglB family)
MPFRDLLKQLVDRIEGASGAILIESAGEAVQWHIVDEKQEERLRLRSAYVAVVLQNSRALAKRIEAGQAAYIVLQYDGASFVAQIVERDYFVVVELRPSANIGQAVFYMQPIVEGLRQRLNA